MASSLRIALLGRFRVTVGEREVPRTEWRGRRAAELVQLLALSHGHRLPRDVVIEALFPHLEVESAFANLRKAAHHARQALGDRKAVVLAGGMVELAPGREHEVDTERFEAAALAALSSRNPQKLAEALSVYEGELLPESLYEEWTRAPRERLRARFSELLRAGQRWDLLVELEPSDEVAYQHLMRAALDEHHRSEAIRWYGRLRVALARELGVEPSPETEAIYRECVAGLEPVHPRLWGREEELAWGASILEASRARLLALRGGAGMGKTAICSELSVLAADRGFEVVQVGHSAPADAYGTLAAVIDRIATRSRHRLQSIPSWARDVLGELVPGVRKARAPLSRQRVTGAFRRLLDAGREPALLIVIDDAHLADDASLELFFDLAGGDAGGVAVVLSHRNVRTRPRLAAGVARLQPLRNAIVIDLRPLDPESVRALVAAEAPASIASGAVARIIELSEGNPFMARELAKCVCSDGTLAIGHAGWEAIRGSFVSLDDGSTRMLERLALSGDDLDTEEVVALTGLPEEETFALLDRALACGAMVVADARYRFRHELVRQALAHGVPPHRRVAVHRDAARRLETAGGSPARIAQHWLDGGRAADAVPWWLAAAQRAARLGAFDDALRTLDTLLEHAAHHPGALSLRANVLDALGDGRALAAYAVAAAHAPRPEAEELKARLALARLKSGDPAGALETLTAASPSTLTARVTAALTVSGAAAVGVGDVDAATRAAEQARRLAFESGDPGALVEAAWAESLAAHARGELRARLRSDLAATRDLPELAVRVFDAHLCATQRLLYGALPYDEVIRFADALGAEATRLGAARGRAFSVTLGGEAKLLSGRLDDAERDLVDGAQLHREIAAPAGEALALQRRAELLLKRGKPAEARALLERALAAARESYLAHHLLDRIYGTRISAASGPAEALDLVAHAEDAVRGPLETCPACRVTLAVPAAIAAAQFHDMERAAQFASVVDQLATVIVPAVGWKAAAEEVRGHLGMAERNLADAGSRFERAAALYREAGQPLDAARCAALARGG